MAVGAQSSHPQISSTLPNPDVSVGPSRAPGKSLFASILAHPPAKRARTIHNPEAPPVPAPSLHGETPSRKSTKKVAKRGKVSKGLEVEETSRLQGRSRKGKEKEERSLVATPTPLRSPRRYGRGRANSTASAASGSTRLEGDGTSTSELTDMRAAATLTDLLFSSRNPGSPRSATSASRLEGTGRGTGHGHVRTGSNLSIGSHLEDERTATPTSVHPSFHLSAASHGQRLGPPPSFQPNIFGSQSSSGHLSPHPSSQPQSQTDNEAADLMLLLANSPSPVRPSPSASRTQDKERERGVHAASRVLFPSAASMSAASAASAAGKSTSSQPLNERERRDGSASPAETERASESGTSSAGSPISSEKDTRSGVKTPESKLAPGFPLAPGFRANDESGRKARRGEREMDVDTEGESTRESTIDHTTSPMTSVTRPLSALKLHPPASASISASCVSSSSAASSTSTPTPSSAFPSLSFPESSVVPNVMSMLPQTKSGGVAGGTHAWLRTTAASGGPALGVGSPLRHSFDGE